MLLSLLRPRDVALARHGIYAVFQSVRATSSNVSEHVDALNRELADVFGAPVPDPPEGTCLGPRATPDAAPPLPEGQQYNGAAASSDGSVGGADAFPQQQQQLPPTSLAAVLHQLRQCAMQLQGLQQQLQQLQQQAEPPVGGGAQDAGSWAQQQLRPTLPSPITHQRQQRHRHDQQQQQQQLSHVDASGRAAMVDVGHKLSTGRIAAASCFVRLGRAAYDAVASNTIAKGDVLRVAQVAGIQGAKATAALIPLCHPIALSSVNVDLSLRPAEAAVHVVATARAAGQTGVEMEALVGAAVAALTVYDMAKGVSKGIVVDELRLEFKEGGKSGVWRRGGGGGGGGDAGGGGGGCSAGPVDEGGVGQPA